MTSIRDDIAGLVDKVKIFPHTTARLFASEVGLSVGTITNHRPYRVDSAELAGFIYRTVMDPGCWPDGVSAAALADAIVDRFKLDKGN